MFQLVTEGINTADLIAAASLPSCGAVVVFEGRVRDHHHGREVIALAYSGHPKLTAIEGEKLIEETMGKFPEVEMISASHREGHLEVGEIAVGIAVCSAHRPAAFEACDYLASQLKDRLPMWKQEFFGDGTSSWT